MHSPDGDRLRSNIRNEDTVAIEVCHPDETGAFSPAAYQQVVELTAGCAGPSIWIRTLM